MPQYRGPAVNRFAGKYDEAILQLLSEHALRERGFPIVHTVQVTSYGGSGSAALTAHLNAAGLDLPRTPGNYPFHHNRHPPDPVTVPAGFRVIYIYADPRNALLSIFARGGQIAYFRAMNRVFEIDPEIESTAGAAAAVAAAIARTSEIDPAIERRLQSLDSYLEAGVDEFGLADHVDRWLDPRPLGYPRLSVALESLHSSWPVVRDFLDLPPDYPCLPPASRSSDWRRLSAEQRDRINDMYGALAERLAAEPPANVIE
jgi:hypothetical protein